MAPNPQVKLTSFDDDEVSQEKVVISGMAGLYPQSHNVKEFRDILYNKVNPIQPNNARWKYKHPEVAESTGRLPELEYFDAQFFKVHYRLGNSMDSMSRKILEQAFDAIYDAGINPDQLSGTKVGVYLGTCFSETEKACFYVATSRTGFGIAGCSKSMFANRISYWLNAKGPSMSVDQACCSSNVALELAYQAIRRGEIDSAIVGGTNLCLHPQSTVHYGRIMKLSKDGITKSFDKNSHGCAKSEAINVLFLQKATDAVRVYAEVVYVKSEFCGLTEGKDGPLYSFYREPSSLAEFLKKFYEEANVPPQSIEYVEALGCAMPDVDKAELESLDKVFCNNRDDPLLVGSVMSNLGYVEAASGISAVTKVLLGYENGEIAANLNCDDPIEDIDAIRKGKMQIVIDHKPLKQGYIAVNGLSVTGVNSHILLKGLNKPKDINRFKTNIPHLLTISGRQKSAVEKIFDDLKTRPIDPEELALFHNIHQAKISGHLGRGYILLDTNNEKETVVLSEKTDFFDDLKRPLWFVYSGMGSQWAGMGAQLMRIPIFAAAIERCRRVLEPKGIDIVHIITAPDKKIFDNILNSFVGIAAVQIGLTDVLQTIGIVPDKIIGHSVGELGCAYADGCLTAEEMILSAYSRGLVSVQSSFIRGSMAAVGIGYQQVIKLCPPEIEVACHNSSESSTISGPADIMRQFVETLTAKGIFAKEVPCSNIAYHSRYIAEAGPNLLKYLKEVIKTPRARTERWVSTSIPEDRWAQPLAKFSSAEYHTNNLLCPVLFEETSKHIPKDAVLVEIAPHGLLQAILKRSLPHCVNIPLTRRGHQDNVVMVLDAIGKLFMNGYCPKVQELYPKVEFPVSTGTPMLGHLIEWAHMEKWNLPLYVSAHRKTAAACKYVISLHDDEHSYLRGHVIREKKMYPFSAVLVAVWDTLAMSLGLKKKSLSVQFESVRFLAQPILHDTQQLTLSVSLQRGAGKFEVLYNNEKTIIATGFVKAIPKNDNERMYARNTTNSDEKSLNSNDVYKLLCSRDYEYSGEFRSLQSVKISLNQAEVAWKGNWVTFIDGLLQLNTLKRQHTTVSQPDSIRKLIVDIDEHSKIASDIIVADIIDIYDCTRAGGVLIESLSFRDLPLIRNNTSILKSLAFVPHLKLEKTDVLSAGHVYLQIIAENINKGDINSIEIENCGEIAKHLDVDNLHVPGIKFKHNATTLDEIVKRGLPTTADVIFVHNLSTNTKITNLFTELLSNNTFIINVETRPENTIEKQTPYTLICSHNIGDKKIELLKWKAEKFVGGTSAFTVLNQSNLLHMISTLESIPIHQRLLVFASHPPIPKLVDVVKELRKSGRKINLVMLNHKFDEGEVIEDLPKNDLAISVLDHGVWGGYYYLPTKTQHTNSQDAKLQTTVIGDLDSLQWVKIPKTPVSGINVNVHYAGINESDVKRASGVIKFPKNLLGNYYGMDFSGVTDSGTKVMGLINGGAVSSRVVANPNLLWPVPDHWTLEEAATIPLAYCQAFYCLSMKNRFFPGKRVLIHGGSGALGQAAISICLAYNCEVFATVSDIRKKQFLRKLFPQLKEQNIGYSRDNTFGDMVLSQTKGKRCDIVLSCVRGDLKNVSLRSCGSSGIVVDVAQIQNHDDYNFGMNSLTDDRSYKICDFSSIFREENVEIFKLLQAQVSEGIVHGYVRPLTRIVYAPENVPRAFRLVAASQHRGRVLINMKLDKPIKRTRITYSPENYHILISDDDVLVAEVIDRLIDQGVRKVHLITSEQSGLLLYKISKWQNVGVHFHQTVLRNIWNKDNVSKILNSVNKHEIEGIYTIITNDRMFSKIHEFLEDLDLKTREICPLLRFFAIINENSEIGEQVAIKRRNCRHAATLVKLPALRTNENVVAQMSLNSAIEAIEEALLLKETVALAVPSPKKIDFMKDICTWADITLPTTINEHLTLLELGMNLSKTLTLQACLRDYYNLWLTEAEIQNLTVQRIKEEGIKISELEFNDPPGLAAFYSYIDSDELLASTEMTFLSTLTNSSSMRDDEFDADQAFLCIIPGAEGHHKRFQLMCERLKLPALVLQPKTGHDSSLKELASRFAEILLIRTGLKNNFYLLGYESGVIVALEIAAILEDKGLTGTVYCLGGTPKEIQAHFHSKLTDMADDVSLQEAVGRHMVKLMSGQDTWSLDESFKRATTWHERIECCVRDQIGRVTYSAQYTRELIKAAHSRIVQVKKYSNEPKKLRSLLVLMRAELDLPEDVTDSLQDYSLQPVVEYKLAAPLSYAANDLSCAAIINRHLDNELLKAYEDRNICETYLLNADTFMTSATEL